MDIENQIKDALKGKKVKRLLLQVPDGLKQKVIEIVDILEKQGIEIFISAEPCYGACDLRIEEAKLFNCDAILHLGHKKFIDVEFDVIYVPIKLDAYINIEKILKIVKENSIGISTTVQYEHLLERIANKLKHCGKKVEIAGSILGCKVDNLKKLQTDAILFIGSGRFHVLGLRAINKPVYYYDVETHDVEKMNFYKEIKKYIAKKSIIKNAHTIGIIVSTKYGQCISNKQIENVKSKIVEMGKKPYIIILDEVKIEKLPKCDAYVNTACPRLIDELQKCINLHDLFL